MGCIWCWWGSGCVPTYVLYRNRRRDMDTAPQIAFHGFDGSPSLRRVIEEKIDNLERFYPHIVTCEVTVEQPHKSKNRGNHWRVKIVVSIPGEDVRVTRETEIERHEDPLPTVRDAFAQAKRQLQERRSRQVGEVKHHEEAPVATVHALGADHGFISTLDGRQLYFHANSVLNGGFDDLSVGAKVTFVEEDGVEGPQASTVRLYDLPT
jgi:cold shock CspA family protein/ribosome-associated translation inhibitor RaiA